MECVDCVGALMRGSHAGMSQRHWPLVGDKKAYSFDCIVAGGLWVSKSIFIATVM